jgi:hypothetical protein
MMHSESQEFLLLPTNNKSKKKGVKAAAAFLFLSGCLRSQWTKKWLLDEGSIHY